MSELSAVSQEIIEKVENMSVLELNDLVKALEEKFDVTAAAPVAVAAAGAAPAAGGDAGGDDGSSEVDVILTGAGDKKIQVLKVVRELTGLGLKEAKELVDGAPKPVKEGIDPEEAKEIKAKIEEAGGQVEVK